MNWIYEQEARGYISGSNLRAMSNALEIVSRRKEQFWTGDETSLKIDYGIDTPKGRKCSKILRAICIKYGADKLVPPYEDLNTGRKVNEFEREFAPLADSVNELILTNTAVLSIHPCDFLSVSNGNSWRSCHDIGFSYLGEWSSGVLSYFNDNSSMVFYTVGDKVDSDYHLEKKLTRQMFHYNKGTLVQSKLYPDSGNNELHTLYRNVVQGIIAEASDKPNAWTLLRVQRDVSKRLTTARGSTHYKDYLNGCGATSSLLRDSVQVKVRIGSKPLCFKCGHEYSRSSGLCCSTCPSECNKCGKAIGGCYGMQYNIVGGQKYCVECSFRCNSCRREVVGERHYVTGSNRFSQISACDECFTNLYSPCSECGQHFRTERMYDYEDGSRLCVRCFNREDNVREGLVANAATEADPMPF